MTIEITASQWRQMRDIADDRDRWQAECEEWVQAHDALADRVRELEAVGQVAQDACEWALERLIDHYGDDGELSGDLVNAIEQLRDALGGQEAS